MSFDPRPLVQEAERRAEWLVGLLRMATALALLLVFILAVSPGQRVPDEILRMQWIFALLGMGGYFLLGLVGWALARSSRFRRWMVWPLVAGDCLFVLSSLWSSLDNTGLGPALTLGFPSAWLVPLVLAFGALRLDPKVLVVMTLVLVIGLSGMIWGDPGPAEMNDRALIGMASFFESPPNMMRLAMIAGAGILLALAVLRSRRLLFRSIAEAQRNTNLTRYLPSEVAARLAAGDLEALRRGDRHAAGILFVDMRGFTGMAQEMPVADLSELMTAFRGIVLNVANDTGGIVDKFMGDAAMIVFEGGPDNRATARQCLRCASGLQTAIRDWSEQRRMRGLAPVRVGVGAHWGVVFSGVIGGEDRLEYSVFGDAVNIAARLEALTKELGHGVVVSREIVEQAGEVGAWHALPDVEIRGRRGVLAVMGHAEDGIKKPRAE